MGHAVQGVGSTGMDFDGIDKRAARQQRAHDVADPRLGLENPVARFHRQAVKEDRDCLGGRRIESQISGNSRPAWLVVLGARGVGGCVRQRRAVVLSIAAVSFLSTRARSKT